MFLGGLTEGIFPSARSLEERKNDALEEERRLCYVGITRAMKCLSLSAAKHRMLRGETLYNKPSRFIHEIPRYLMKINMPEKEVKISFGREASQPFSEYHQSQKNYKPFTASEPKNFEGSNMGSLDYGVGDTVRHVKFGTGIVTDIVMGGRDYEITVEFDSFGTKKLIASFAKLTRLD